MRIIPMVILQVDYLGADGKLLASHVTEDEYDLGAIAS
jgi:hypothetical protein